ncbi:putative RING zinc finger and VWF domain family protein isoform X2 [Iris pallida]|uniref:RING zinc finger and VWF domain family protein isoform X2 n=1 Tax=Iris pallida TaxID=29817 RepID=A0AAX6GYG4_IRIPA|nr:putative RING zinc finger and VWF domain family protein isoform X2 [Iris pallida]
MLPKVCLPVQSNCGICRSSLTRGLSESIFTAECSHGFHYHCIANNVEHGNLCCPVCGAKWNKDNVPFQAPPLQQNNTAARIPPNTPVSSPQLPRRSYLRPLPAEEPRYPPEPPTFSDDEPLLSSSTAPTGSSVPQNITVKTHTESSAIPAAESSPNFPVLVSIRAPPLKDPEGHGRTPVDLVTVLDVSGSMSGTKLSLLKQAVTFVVENLGPSDRLSVVSFSSSSRRVFPLQRMTVDGRESAILAVESLRAGGATNIAEGLKKGSRVLEDRRERNPVCSIILLSDGKDTCSRGADRLLSKLPASLRSDGMRREIPVHTFGFGYDHDPDVMHSISDMSGGTFSFIESVATIQDAFALCIGGLLSVVAQEVRLTVRSASPGVKIVAIPSGRHVNEISDEGRQGVVHIANMYAEEEKQFLVYLSVPESAASHSKTSLLDVLCVYRDLASNEPVVQVRGERIEVLRPEVCSPAEKSVSLEVDRQRNRILVADAIAEAQRLAETGNLEGAQALLAERKATVAASTAAQAGDFYSNLFETELGEIMERMATMNLYRQSGRAYALAGMSSHMFQRATTRGDTDTAASCLNTGSGPHRRRRRSAGGGYSIARAVSAGAAPSESAAVVSAFETPAMVRMVQKSQQKRTQPEP